MPDHPETAEDEDPDAVAVADDELYNAVVIRGLDPQGRAADMGDLAPADLVPVFCIEVPRRGVFYTIHALPLAGLSLPLITVIGIHLYTGFGFGNLPGLAAMLTGTGTGAGLFSLLFSASSRTAYRRGHYSSAIVLALVPVCFMALLSLFILVYT